MPASKELEYSEQRRIPVIMRNGMCHQYDPQLFDVMLDFNLVVKFERASGWVTVGIDPIRVKHKRGEDCNYIGSERRTTGSTRRIGCIE